MSTVAFSDELVSTEVKEWLDIVINLYGNLIVCSVGLVTNILNIIVFAKQGLTDTITTTLITIAVFDLLTSIGGLQLCSEALTRYSNPVVANNWQHAMGPAVVILSYMISVVSGVITAYLSLSRCLSVVAPLKVKNIITPRVNRIIIIVLSALSFLSISQGLGWNKIEWAFSPVFNTTVLRTVPNLENIRRTRAITVIFTLMWPFISFVTMVLCTIVIVSRLRKSTMFVQNAIADGQGAEKQKLRDRKITKMLLVIIAIYVVAVLPRLGSYVLRLTMEDFDNGFKQENFFYSYQYIVTAMNHINAAVNFFVYFKMSTPFRQTLFRMFRKLRRL